MRRRMMLLLTVALVFSVSGGQKARSASRTSAGPTETANEVLAFERQMEAAVVRGDVAYLAKVIAVDFMFTHGDGWTAGGEPLKVDDRVSWLEAVGKAPYLRRDLDSVKVEMHGDIAITYGRYVADFKNAQPDRTRFTVWFERVYAKRNGQWQYLSHRTVKGPIYGRPPVAGAK
jgi:hypothetical protein